jgi:hypothetical protein
MKELIEALQILMKYGNPSYPFHCEHDILHIVGFDAENISKQDKDKLYQLGIIVRIEGETDHDGEEIRQTEIYSFRYGSA